MKHVLLYSIILLCSLHTVCCAQEKYTILLDPSVGEKVEYAIGKLEEALLKQDLVLERASDFSTVKSKQLIVVGLAAQGHVSDLLRIENRIIPEVAEALAVWKTSYRKKEALVIAGHDEQGLMYALLDVALRIGWGSKKNPFEYVEDIVEQPELATRAISMYTMNRTLWESKFYDKNYWAKYFDVLSQNRFNSFVIIFGYENGGFLAPPYPYFFNVDGYPDVRMVGLSSTEQQRNLSALNDLIDMAHQRGIRLSVAIWDHIYRGGIQSGGMTGLEKADKEPLNGLVWGVTGENLIAYTKAALARLVELVPGLDGIEFRMHGESGLKHGEQEAFWTDIFKSMKVAAPDMNVILRAKDMPESVIQAAIGEKINFRIETKYWMEQMGFPYHSTHINRQNQKDRRQSYADMLRYPQQYKMYWRLWNGGTTRMLLWGNPEYAQRFVESAKLYAGDAYEVTEPLATKMESMPHDMQPFELLNPAYRYYDYEFERYWHFFQVFGRMGYNPQQSPDIWQKEFEARFGEKAAPLVEQALHEASWVLPRIVASTSPYGCFPTTRGWAEKQRLGDLYEYALAEGSDIQQFTGFDEEARLLIEGGGTAKIRQSMNSVWFGQLSERLDKLILEAGKATGKSPGKEFVSTMTDLRILSNLALYHSRRIPAAVCYRIFVRTNDISALEKAIEHEKNAIEAWKQIVASAGDVYAPNLMFGVPSSYFDGLNHKLTGHWKDELIDLEKGLAKLEQQKNDFKPKVTPIAAPAYQPAKAADNGHLFQVELERVEKLPEGHPLTVRAKVSGKNEIKWVRLRYRAVNQKLDYATLPMKWLEEKNMYQAVVPMEEMNPGFDFMYFIEVMDSKGNGKIYPDLMEETPYIISTHEETY
ncbi:hypothetical protein [Bacteroides sp. 51]|uniref:hypothetical protein n=1 Tax=Bacteroides sp. 51 TaxID=2302938 RepID=UPI0013D5A7E4|nr:hypothetical protein [Bacteroides sp. 51]NDV81568.1 hypothetical protein [Bacteroides sp. 51]